MKEGAVTSVLCALVFPTNPGPMWGTTLNRSTFRSTLSTLAKHAATIVRHISLCWSINQCSTRIYLATDWSCKIHFMRCHSLLMYYNCNTSRWCFLGWFWHCRPYQALWVCGVWRRVWKAYLLEMLQLLPQVAKQRKEPCRSSSLPSSLYLLMSSLWPGDGLQKCAEYSHDKIP